MQNKDNAFQAVIPNEPHGHELHLFRQDSDQFMAAIAIFYGAKILQDTAVHDIHITTDSVAIKTPNDYFIADYIVDAGGFKSILADKFSLRNYDLKSHSRTLFTHMINVPDFHKIASSKNEYSFPYNISEGTLHHIFKGGWLWIIPFNNHDKSTNPLCSVGLQLDPRIYPLDESVTAEEEFNAFIARFPDIKKQLNKAKSVRSWVRTGRIQYSSRQVIGNRFALLGHAAGFIDPLFSKGLYASFNSVSNLANLLLTDDGSYSTEHFKPFEQQTLKFIQSHDRLVANSYKSFSNYKLWDAYKVLWLLGAYTEFVKLMSSRTKSKNKDEYFEKISCLCLTGGGFNEYQNVANKIDSLIELVNLDDEKEIDAVASQIKNLLLSLDWLPQAFRDTLNGKKYLPKNKLRWKLLNHDTGFMGKGLFRQHFFPNITTVDLLTTFLNEKLNYSKISIQKKTGNIKGFV